MLVASLEATSGSGKRTRGQSETDRFNTSQKIINTETQTVTSITFPCPLPLVSRKFQLRPQAEAAHNFHTSVITDKVRSGFNKAE